MNKTQRFVATAFALVALIGLSTPADAGVFGRVRDAGRALFTEASAQRGWVTISPMATASGDFETIAISTAGSDPSKPAYIVRFQRTDAEAVGNRVQPGVLLTLRKFQIELGGPLPVVIVQSYNDRGWRAKNVPRASETYATWGYLIAGRAAAAGDGSLYEQFFRTRHGARAQLEADVVQVSNVVFPGGVPGPDVEALPVACEKRLEACEISAQECKTELGFTLSSLRTCESTGSSISTDFR